MTWNLRYASHLGYRSPDLPLFKELAGSLDPVAHVDLAADLGFAGVQYALAVTRPPDEVERVSRALDRRGLEAGCILYAPLPVVTQPLWVSVDPDAVQAWRRELMRSIEVARRLNARNIAIMSGADPRRPLSMQRAAFTENLRRAADDAERAGVVLCLETMNRRSLPNMLLGHIGDAYDVVKSVGSPAVRLIFDTSHVQIMDGDLLRNLEATWDAIALVQLADNPDRLEPGSGEINFLNVLRTLRRLGYTGLVELEHGWSAPTRDAEARGVEYLRELDGRLDIVG